MGWTVMTVVMVVFFVIVAIASVEREKESSKKFEKTLKNKVGKTQNVLSLKTLSPEEMNSRLMVPNIGGSPHYDPDFGEGELVVRKF